MAKLPQVAGGHISAARVLCSYCILGFAVLGVESIEADVLVELVAGPFTPVIFEPGIANNIALTTRILNNGPDAIPAVSPGDINVNFSLIFAESSDALNAVDAAPSSMYFDDNVQVIELNVSAPNLVTTIEATLLFPEEGCSIFSHLCVYVENITFSDPDLTNNPYCILFNDAYFSAGYTNCSSDIKPTLFSVTSPYNNTYRENQTTSIVFTVGLVNCGGVVIDEAPVGNHNFGFTAAVLSSQSDLQSPTVVTTTFDVDVTMATNLHVGLELWKSTQIENLTALLTVPSDNCEMYRYLCVVISTGQDSAIIDSDLGNNDLCVELGDGSVGSIFCENLTTPSTITTTSTTEEDNTTQVTLPLVFGSLVIVGFVVAAIVLFIKFCGNSSSDPSSSKICFHAKKANITQVGPLVVDQEH